MILNPVEIRMSEPVAGDFMSENWKFSFQRFQRTCGIPNRRYELSKKNGQE